mmetsp:Transcript_25666/g.81498  ORF Transcript_25666/g.81498 Transcript_25666/m.81498 type:complete len:613 (-) Transcript_25666:2437-4275(-)
MAVWFKMINNADPANSQFNLLIYGRGGGQKRMRFLQLNLEGSEYTFSLGINGGLYVLPGEVAQNDLTLRDTPWTHLCITVDSSKFIRFYINGELQGSPVLGTDMLEMTDAFRRLSLGESKAGFEHCQLGFHNWMLFNGAIPDSQVSQIYNNIQAPDTNEITSDPTHVIVFDKYNTAANTYPGATITSMITSTQQTGGGYTFERVFENTWVEPSGYIAATVTSNPTNDDLYEDVYHNRYKLNISHTAALDDVLNGKSNLNHTHSQFNSSLIIIHDMYSSSDPVDAFEGRGLGLIAFRDGGPPVDASITLDLAGTRVRVVYLFPSEGYTLFQSGVNDNEPQVVIYGSTYQSTFSRPTMRVLGNLELKTTSSASGTLNCDGDVNAQSISATNATFSNDVTAANLNVSGRVRSEDDPHNLFWAETDFNTTMSVQRFGTIYYFTVSGSQRVLWNTSPQVYQFKITKVIEPDVFTIRRTDTPDYFLSDNMTPLAFSYHNPSTIVTTNYHRWRAYYHSEGYTYFVQNLETGRFLSVNTSTSPYESITTTYDESMMDFGESPKDVSYWVKKYPGFDPMVHQIMALSYQGMKRKQFRSELKKMVKKQQTGMTIRNNVSCQF